MSMKAGYTLVNAAGVDLTKTGAVTFKYNMDTVSIANTNVITITPYTPPEST